MISKSDSICKTSGKMKQKPVMLQHHSEWSLVHFCFYAVKLDGTLCVKGRKNEKEKAITKAAHWSLL